MKRKIYLFGLQARWFKVGKLVLMGSLLLLGTCITGFAQQENHYTHFMYTKQLINPGYVGSKGMPSFLGLYRRQWIGFEGAPESQLLAFNMPFFDPRVGFGIVVGHQKTGDFDEFIGNLAYSYDMINEKDLNLRFGIMGSIKRLSLDILRSGSVIRNPGDPAVSHISGNNNQFPLINGNVGAGVYLNIKGAYLGLSVPNILSNKLGDSASPNPAKETPHVYLMSGAIIPIPGSVFQFYPNVLFKYVENTPFSLDINLSAIYNNMLTFGASYRYGDTNGDSVDFLAMFQTTSGFGVGVAYDLPVSDIRDYNSGSIELMLSYNLGKKNPDMTNPRFFF